MGPVCRTICVHGVRAVRHYSGPETVAACTCEHRCKLLVVGGGAGGCNIAWRFSRKLKDKEIIVLEPSKFHYYQPLFTLVAAGVKNLNQSKRHAGHVLPPNVIWFKDHVHDFDPCNNLVYTKCGDRICYDYMVVALGLQNNYDRIAGLKQALDNPKSGVSTIYSPEYCSKTWGCIKGLKGGHAVFTFPVKGGKCPGAAQKIMYLADDYWRQHKVRNLTSISYNTGGDTLFGVPKYGKALTNVAKNRDITVNCKAELVEVTPTAAVFRSGCHNQTITLPYNFLHVTPHMSAPQCLQVCKDLVNDTGYLDVDKFTLQHVKYHNVYGIGDCTSTPNSKTAAAVSSQAPVVEENLMNTMKGKQPTAKYDGYAACPMLTSYKRGILAEFVYDKKPCETMPFDQSKERRIVYLMKSYLFPYLYWNKLITGKWNGPGRLRRIMHPFTK